MAKGDDAIARKKNKKNRKKQQQEKMNVSKRVASMIAAKKRRKSGKRRKCQGMCFSLPTPEDPFNDKQGQVGFKITRAKISSSLKANSNKSELSSAGNKKNTRNNLKNEKRESVVSTSIDGHKVITMLDKANIQMLGKCGARQPIHSQVNDYPGCPSKFLILCLNSIQNALQHDGCFSSEADKSLFVNPWGVDFWKCYSMGKDIMETSGTCSNIVQIAWIASTAADTITRKEREGHSFTTPFLLFIVPSREKAAKIRSVCKPLKALGIHTVSLHPGASLDHQIDGLRNCEPEFLVSTPERLLELVSLKAVDISGLSLLVVDGLEAFFRGSHLDTIMSIRQSVVGDPQMVAFSDCSSDVALPTLQKIVQGSFCRLSYGGSGASQTSTLNQSVHMCASEEGSAMEKDNSIL